MSGRTRLSSTDGQPKPGHQPASLSLHVSGGTPTRERSLLCSARMLSAILALCVTFPVLLPSILKPLLNGFNASLVPVGPLGGAALFSVNPLGGAALFSVNPLGGAALFSVNPLGGAALFSVNPLGGAALFSVNPLGGAALFSVNPLGGAALFSVNPLGGAALFSVNPLGGAISSPGGVGGSSPGGDTIPLSSGGTALFSVNPLGGAVLFSGDPLAYLIAVAGKNNDVTIKSTNKMVVLFNVPFIGT